MQFIICEHGRSFSALESEQWCCIFIVTTTGYDSIPVIHRMFDVHSNIFDLPQIFTYSLSEHSGVLYFNFHSETCMGYVQGNRLHLLG